MRNTIKTSYQLGFTLIELIITLVIIGILATLAVPSMSNIFDNTKVVGLVEKMRVDLEWARTQAIKDNTNVIMEFGGSGTTWCYGFDDTDANCDCNSTSCQVSGQVKTVNQSDFSGTSVTPNISNGRVTLTNRGFLDSLPANRTITVSSGNALAQLTISRMGRVAVCSNTLSQYPTC